MTEKQKADITESYLEYRADFSAPMFDCWILPNPLIPALYGRLRSWGVGLGDITWNKEAGSLQDLQLTVNVTRLNAIAKLGIGSVTFIAMNPDWSEAPALIDLFESLMQQVLETGKRKLASQEIALAMHVKPGPTPFRDLASRLVNAEALGPAQMYGVSIYSEDATLVIDKSLRYENSAFLRLYRKFDSSASFKDLAAAVYADELKALGLLGLQELMET